jgi:hypothetical protein
VVPAWFAAIVHEPSPTSVTVLPATAHVAGVSDETTTGLPELPPAACTAYDVPSTAGDGGGEANVIAWAVCVTRKLCVARDREDRRRRALAVVRRSAGGRGRPGP